MRELTLDGQLGSKFQISYPRSLLWIPPLPPLSVARSGNSEPKQTIRMQRSTEINKQLIICSHTSLIVREGGLAEAKDFWAVLMMWVRYALGMRRLELTATHSAVPGRRGRSLYLHVKYR